MNKTAYEAIRFLMTQGEERGTSKHVAVVDLYNVAREEGWTAQDIREYAQKGQLKDAVYGLGARREETIALSLKQRNNVRLLNEVLGTK